MSENQNSKKNLKENQQKKEKNTQKLTHTNPTDIIQSRTIKKPSVKTNKNLDKNFQNQKNTEEFLNNNKNNNEQ